MATAYLWLSLMRAMSRLICGATNMEDWLGTGATVDTSRHQLSQRADYLVFKKRSAEQDMFTSKEFHLQMGSSLSDWLFNPEGNATESQNRNVYHDVSVALASLQVKLSLTARQI